MGIDQSTLERSGFEAADKLLPEFMIEGQQMVNLLPFFFIHI